MHGWRMEGTKTLSLGNNAKHGSSSPPDLRPWVGPWPVLQFWNRRRGSWFRIRFLCSGEMGDSCQLILGNFGSHQSVRIEVCSIPQRFIDLCPRSSDLPRCVKKGNQFESITSPNVG